MGVESQGWGSNILWISISSPKQAEQGRRNGWGKEPQERIDTHSRCSQGTSLCQHCSHGLSILTQDNPDGPHFRNRRHREVNLHRVTLWEWGARLSPELGFRICNHLLHGLQERGGVWSEIESWGNGEGWQAAEAEGCKFHNPPGPEACPACRSRETPPSCSCDLWNNQGGPLSLEDRLLGWQMGKVRGRAFGEMVSPAASVPRSQEACSSLILGGKGPGPQGAALSPGPAWRLCTQGQQPFLTWEGLFGLPTGLSRASGSKGLPSRGTVSILQVKKQGLRESGDLPKTQLVRAAEGSRPGSGDSGGVLPQRWSLTSWGFFFRQRIKAQGAPWGRISRSTSESVKASHWGAWGPAGS